MIMAMMMIMIMMMIIRIIMIITIIYMHINQIHGDIYIYLYT